MAAAAARRRPSRTIRTARRPRVTECNCDLPRDCKVQMQSFGSKIQWKALCRSPARVRAANLKYLMHLWWNSRTLNTTLYNVTSRALGFAHFSQLIFGVSNVTHCMQRQSAVKNLQTLRLWLPPFPETFDQLEFGPWNVWDRYTSPVLHWATH